MHRVVIFVHPRNLFPTFPNILKIEKILRFGFQYSETNLYEQISYYQSLLDVNEASKKFTIPSIPEMISAYDHLKEFVEKQLARSAYSVVDFDKIFSTSVQQTSAIVSVDEEEQVEFNFSDEELVSASNAANEKKKWKNSTKL